MAELPEPAIGTVEDGYRYKGGGRYNQSSWEPVPVSGADLLPSGPRQGDRRSEEAYYSKFRTASDGPFQQAQAAVGASRRAEGLIARQEAQGQGTGGIYAIPIIGDVAGMFDPEIRELDAIQAGAARANRTPGEGAISDFDAKQFVVQTYGKDKPLETNKNLIQASRLANDASIQQREFQEWFYNKYNTLSGASEAWRNYAQRNPIFDPSAQQDDNNLVLNPNRENWRQFFTGEEGLDTQASIDAARTAGSRAGPIDPDTGLPTYSGLSSIVANAGISDNGGGIPPSGSGPQPGDVVTTSQPLAPEDTPASLAAQGYVYDSASDTWKRTRTAEARGWTPESAVAQRDAMWQPLRQVDAFGRGFADAASLEFADEIAAGGDALLGRGNGDSIGDRYRSNVAVQRAVDKADGEDAGFARNLGEVAGYGASAVLAAPRFLAQAGGRIASPLIRGAVTGVRNALVGAGVAGTAAAGQEQGNALERAQAFLKAAPVGAVVGAAAPVAVNYAAPRVVGALAGPGRAAGRFVGGIGEQLGVPGATRLTERSTPNALQSAVERYGSRMGPRRVGALQENANQQRLMGFEPTLADVVDDAGQGQLRSLGSIDTAARPNAVAFGRARRQGAQGDVSNIARRFVSDDPRTASRVSADLADAQRAASGPAYDAARASPPITVTADVGEALFSGNGPQQIRGAASAYKSSVKPEERVLALELQSMADAAEAGMPAGNIEMSVGAADLLSRYLGKAGGQDANLNRIFGGLGREIRNQARQQSPEYEAALSGYAERAQLDDAVDFGRRFLTRRGNQDFANEAANMLPAQRDVARVAARDAIEDAGSTTGGAASLLDDLSIGQGTGMKADALINDPEAMRATADAARMRLQTGRNVDPRAGSNTNLNRMDTDNVEGAVEFLRDGARIVSSPIRGTIDVVARRFQNRGFNPQEAEELVNAAIDPARTDELIAMLSQRMPRKEARTLARAVQRQISSGSGSSSAE